MGRYDVFGPQAGTLRHTEPMLLVDDHIAEVVKLHTVFNHGMCAYEYVERAVLQLSVDDIALLFARHPVSSLTFIPIGATISRMVS